VVSLSNHERSECCHPRAGGDPVRKQASEAKKLPERDVKSGCIKTLLKLCRRCALFVAATLLMPFVTFAAPGDLDPTFGNAGRVLASVPGWIDHRARSISAQSDGKVLVAGTCAQFDGVNVVYGICVNRYLPSGMVDSSFGTDGQFFQALETGSRSVSLTIRPDGKLLIAALCYEQGVTQTCLIRATPAGAIDTQFGSQGVVRAPVVDGVVTVNVNVVSLSGNKFLVVGYCSVESENRYCAARFNDDGSRDLMFQVPAGAVPLSGSGLYSILRPPGVAEQSDGKIVVTGACNVQGDVGACAIRFEASGVLDLTYAGSGVAQTVIPQSAIFWANASSFHVGESVIIAGACSTQLRYGFCAVRFLASGAIDTSFGSNGTVVFPSSNDVDDGVTGISIQSDSRVVLSGYCAGLGHQGSGSCAVRLLQDGTVDVSYGDAGTARFNVFGSGIENLTSGELTIDSKVIVVGECYGDPQETSSNFRLCLARLKGGPYDAATCALNADLNNQVAGNDGVLAIRYLLGYTGDALTSGALGADPGRTAQQITDHFDELKSMGKLDVDGDGEVNAMTDGLLILRAMLGLSGDALVAGARNASHPNVRDAKQILTWIELTHGVACLP
jgi:uncharacterized delta-60 repeat protein